MWAFGLVTPLKSNEGGVAESDEEKAKLLNIFFSTVFTEENKLSDEKQNVKVNSQLKVPCLTQEEVQRHLKKIKIDK